MGKTPISWLGVYPAMTTPFDAEDRVDYIFYEKNLRAQLDAGASGIILGGTLGEASSLSNQEKMGLVLFTKEKTAGLVPVIVNIAEQTTRAAVELAQNADHAGACHGLMLLPPMRYRDDREVLEYFREIAAATALPIMVYNNPVDYKIEVTLDMFDAMRDWPTVQAVKESTRGRFKHHPDAQPFR